MNVRPAPIRRILVALDSSTASLAALEGAAILAARLEAELMGLFVEDENLLKLAGLPFAVELGALSAGGQTLGPEQMEQRLRAQASRAEQALTLIARRYARPAEFRVVRGQVLGQILAAMEDADLTALGSVGAAVINRLRLGQVARSAIVRAARPLLLLPPGGAVRWPVAAVYDESPHGRRALELAVQLSKFEDVPLLVIAVSEDDRAAAALANSAQAYLDQAEVKCRVVTMRSSMPDQTLATLRRERCAMVVLSADLGLFRDELTRRLLEELGCAVLLAGRSD